MSTATVYDVPDMSCDHCVASITKEVSAVSGVESVDVNLATKSVTVVGGSGDAIVAAIDEAGFDVA
ncbi:MAG: heavy-metal-associated domain-containing protein [Actinomycetia bacterium]|nr:heavy-metal-associated domain-containing protein [Actinomycetes bacterium]MCP4962003.1 heavy-metal-associated domain-containing protein [Actinomycetes bacterium]